MQDYREIVLKSKTGPSDKCLVSTEHFEILNQHKWYNSGNGYVMSRINGKQWYMHRFIFTNILNHQIDEKLIDHKDGNPLNNQVDNIRIATRSENSRNKKKNENLTSDYTGVSRNGKKWEVNIKLEDLRLRALYSDQIHAAHQYNLWCKEYGLAAAKVNDIEVPEDFVEYKKKDKAQDLPKGIYLKTGKYLVRIERNKIRYRVGLFDTLEEAIEAKSAKLVELEEAKLSEPIKEKKKNEFGQCIIEHFNKTGEKIAESLVDEDKYDDLMQYRWYLSGKYAQATVKGKLMYMHRYVLDYSGKNPVDHKNHNTLDNREDNLEISTPQQTALNSASRQGSTSKYVGVSRVKNKEKWLSQIKIHGKNTNLGYFDNEIDASNARQEAYNELFKELELKESS